MARIKDTSVEAVKAAADIVALVEGYTRLRKGGRSLKGLCPFHQEKTPSFVVTPDRGTFKCFGCGEGGDAISFVEKQENLDFVGAIEWLADRFGVQLEYEETSPEQDRARKRRERLFQLLDRAATFYERHLWESESGAFARDYLASRNLGEQTCREFRLGLAPGGAALVRAATGQGYARDELLGAGLANRRGNDYFSRRLLFPLADARGRVRGFQARQLYEDDPLRGKYVNSPEGDLFRKGDLLYGLDLARAAVAKQDRAVIVEGNPDVLALRQAGFEPVVAAMGTALTEQQLRELARLTKRIWLCFDGDKAGQDATLRGMALAAGQGFDIRVVSLPAGTDPADDPDDFEHRLATAEDYLPYRVRIEVERSLPDKERAFEGVREVLRPFAESPERQDAVRLAADRLGLPPELQAGLAPAARARTGALSPKVLEAGVRLERNALAGVVAHAGLLPLLAELTPEHFDLDLHRRVREHLLEPVESTDRELVAALAELHARAAEEAIDEETAKELLLKLRERAIRRELATCDDPERIKELQAAVARIREAVGALT
ncbi:MAG TPA: DNA primase [Gaiellaceae bacterium]|nr:DNA primase [Gaiellaceae bacterium]